MLITVSDFIASVNSDTLPLASDTGEIDQVKIEKAITEATGIITGYLPFLVDEEGNLLSPPPRLKDALTPVVCDIAYYRLTDRVSSDEDARAKYKDSLKLLETFSKQEQEGLEGPGLQTSSIVTTDADEEDHRFFKKGYMV